MSVPPRVLIVDDSPDSRIIYARHLRDEGYDLAVASDGETALLLLTNSLPDLMLLDNRMPGISGLEVLQRLRAAANTADLPIVMITAQDDSEVRMQALKLGADDFISAPVEPIALKTRLRNLIRMRQVTRERAVLKIRQQWLEEQIQEADEIGRNLIHDLKNPLFCMRLLGDTLLRYRESLPLAVQQLAPVLRQEADSCLSLVEELLNFLRDSYQQETYQRIDLRDLLSTVLDELLPMTQAHSTQMSIAWDLPHWLSVQPQRFARVWRNLLSNAIKYSSNRSTPAVEIGYTGQDHFDCFSISDNGIGIPPEQRENVFLPFRRLSLDRDASESSTSKLDAVATVSSGHGVGLAIVKKIVEQHGGQVWIAEREGPGTEFRFTLPRQINRISPSSQPRSEARL